MSGNDRIIYVSQMSRRLEKSCSVMVEKMLEQSSTHHDIDVMR